MTAQEQAEKLEAMACECFSAWVNHPNREMSRQAWERIDPMSKAAWLRVASAASQPAER